MQGRETSAGGTWGRACGLTVEAMPAFPTFLLTSCSWLRSISSERFEILGPLRVRRDHNSDMPLQS